MSKLGSITVGKSNPVRIMGILNLSPESFYKKSIAIGKKSIENKIRDMEEEGADLIDVGGMSTAPYLRTIIPEKTESARIIKAIKIIQKVSNLPISIDTCRAEVARSAMELGVEIINDISGLKYDKEMPCIIEKYNPSLVLCAFSKKLIRGNQIIQTRNLLHASIQIAKSKHISDNKIVIDPAIGFFRKKGVGQFSTTINSDWIKRDLEILNHLGSIKLRYPTLISVSRKSFIGKLLKIKNPDERLYGSLAAESIAVLNGADIIRTHDVQETKEVITITQKLSSRIRKRL